MVLREVEILDKKIRVCFDENDCKGANVSFTASETKLILGLLDEEIHKRRQTELPDPLPMKGMTYEEYMAKRGKK